MRWTGFVSATTTLLLHSDPVLRTSLDKADVSWISNALLGDDLPLLIFIHLFVRSRQNFLVIVIIHILIIFPFLVLFPSPVSILSPVSEPALTFTFY
jgi:hypothetical protein